MQRHSRRIKLLAQRFVGQDSFVNQQRSDHALVHVITSCRCLDLVARRAGKVDVTLEIFEWAQQILGEGPLELLPVRPGAADYPEVIGSCPDGIPQHTS